MYRIVREEKFLAIIALTIAMFVGTQGCSYLQVNTQDIETITALQELKKDADIVYATFLQPEVDQSAIDLFATEIHELWDRQKERGDANRETSAQIEMIGKMFGKHAMNRIDDGAWSKIHHDNCKENFFDLIDITIETEQFKPVKQ